MNQPIAANPENQIPERLGRVLETIGSPSIFIRDYHQLQDQLVRMGFLKQDSDSQGENYQETRKRLKEGDVPGRRDVPELCAHLTFDVRNRTANFTIDADLPGDIPKWNLTSDGPISMIDAIELVNNYQVYRLGIPNDDF